MLLCENVANIRLIVVFATMFLLAPAWADYKVVTYNILSENYLSYGEYDKLPVDVIAWSYRKPRIVAKLLSEDADIIQLQEVEKTSFDDLVQELLPHGYMAVAAYNPPLLSKDFVATFFKEAVFELKSFHIGVYPGRTKTFLDLTLMDKKTQKIFSAINTKLKGGDPTKGPSATGLKQLGILQAYLAEKKTPYLLSGDFNLDPHMAPIKQLKETLIEAHDQQNAISINVASEGPRQLDYIFFSQDMLFTARQDFDRELPPAPSKQEPSDHYSLSARFDIS